MDCRRRDFWLSQSGEDCLHRGTFKPSATPIVTNLTWGKEDGDGVEDGDGDEGWREFVPGGTENCLAAKLGGGFLWPIPVLYACHLATRQATHLLHDQSETLFNELDLTTAKPQSLA
jgi:hypothetical protein